MYIHGYLPSCNLYWPKGDSHILRPTPQICTFFVHICLYKIKKSRLGSWNAV